MARVGVGQAGRFVPQNAVPLHGGIGMTEEYAVGQFFRRVAVFEHLFDAAAYHLDKLAELVGGPAQGRPEPPPPQLGFRR